jgi:ParB-like nuclease domain
MSGPGESDSAVVGSVREVGPWHGPTDRAWLQRIGRGAGLGRHWEEMVLLPEATPPPIDDAHGRHPPPSGGSARPRGSRASRQRARIRSKAGATSGMNFRAAVAARLAEDSRTSESVARLVSSEHRSFEVREIAIDQVEVAPEHAADAELPDEALVASIRRHGVLEPILVRPRAGGRYELLRGARRLRAARAAGLDAIPAVIRAVTELDARELLVRSRPPENVGPRPEIWRPSLRAVPGDAA